MILGVTGPTGAGKDTAAIYLATKLRVNHVSGGDVIRDMLRTLHLPVTKTAVREFSIFLRAQYGPAAIIEQALATADSQGVVCSGFRSLAEANEVKKRGGTIVYIDASFDVRYRRLFERRRDGDSFTEQDLLELDAREQGGKGSGDENLKSICKAADYIIDNNGSLEELHENLDRLIMRVLLQ